MMKIKYIDRNLCLCFILKLATTSISRKGVYIVYKCQNPYKFLYEEGSYLHPQVIFSIN